nr:uncharacterized protein LOC109181763 [Ipomoea trifida]
MTIVDGVVEELVTQGVNSLVRIVSDNVTLVRGIDSEIKDLTSDIQMFNARLVEASKNPRADDHQVLRLIVNKFRSVVNEAEDTIADYVVLKRKHGNHFFLKSLDKTPVCGKVNGYASEIQSIRTKMNAIRQDHEQEVQYLMQYEIKEQDKAVKTFHQKSLNQDCLVHLKPYLGFGSWLGSLETNQAILIIPPTSRHSINVQARPTVEKNEVFGFDKDLNDIKTLLEASDLFSVIPIVGMTGTGKTTFASMLFADLSILTNSVRIWVSVSKWCDIKHKFISIINQITKSIEDLTMMSEDILKDTIQALLKDRKYFIILDDVWEKKDWDSLRTAFPKNMNGSRVLVTTRHEYVVDSTWKSHNLGKLSDDDGWLLIKNNVFGKEGCIDTLEEHGKKIARKCEGLPLALVVVAGILRKCKTSTDWQGVADNPLLEINREDQSYHELVKMSYNDLHHEKLKNCFLYFAYFPMGHEIAIWKLVCLWIAEGFIPTTNEWEYRIDAEVEAQKYLNDLVDRNLVIVIKKRADGQIKTCRIHDTLHEFCKSEAARKNLFLIMDKEERIDENTCSARRLCFHSFTTADKPDDDQNKSSRFFLNWGDQMRSSPFGKHIHSLFLSSPEKSEIPHVRDEIATIPNTFPLLRVLNIEYIKFNGMLPNEVYRLYLLKYIAISGVNLNLLPKSFKNLVELETLVIKTTAKTLQIEGGIWNMEKLRHVRINTSVQLPFPPETNSKTNSGGKGIHTLSTISPASCKNEIFSKIPNLRKLGVRGNLSQLLKGEQETCLFNNLQLPKHLVNLKLYGQYDNVLKVPMLYKFACKLKKLSFSGTLFEWKDMTILGSLEELEMLKLDDYAFKGENWELSNNVVFRRLQYLRIGRTNLVTWKATANSFPALQSLVLRNCNVIKQIPEAFAKVHTLKVMKLFHVSESATQYVKEVRENIKNNGFKLIITSHQKREGAMTAARDTLIEQAVSEAVNRLVEGVVEWFDLGNGGLGWEIKNLIFDIETFNARLEEAYENPAESVNVLIVKNFQTIVNEALDAVGNWRSMYYDHEDKNFRKCLVPRYRREVKSCESEIQSIRTKVNTIDHEHKRELETPCNYENNNAPLIFQGTTAPVWRPGKGMMKSTACDGAIEAIEQKVNMLQQKIEDNVNGVCDVVFEIKDMTSQIEKFTKNLVNACKNPMANEHRVLKVIVKKFSILVNETMNAVTNYFAQQKKNGNNALEKSLDKIAHCGKPNVYGSEIQFIKETMNRIKEDHTKDLLHLSEDYNKRRDMPLPKARPTVEKNEVFGFHKDLNEIKTLLEASDLFSVIPIVGMTGTGKTTFASMLFADLSILNNSVRIWVSVSKWCDIKHKFISIIYQITKSTEDLTMVPEDILKDTIHTLLKDRKYFIVLDDVWEKKDWDSLRTAFPKNMNGSRVLVTTRHEYVVDSTWKSHNLRKLSDDDGWLLIKNNVFGTEGCSDTLEEHGKKIARKCEGLPLALVVVAGILRKCKTSTDWQRVADNPLLEINREDQSYHEIVKMSYNDLPHEKLKNCFLYFAYFPMGHEIAIWKLVCLWIAEGFIPTTNEWEYRIDAEVEAQKYLNDLIDRNLVMVIKKRADGQIKTCRIHDTLHEFCKSEAAMKNLFLVMDKEQSRIDENTCSARRLCFHSFTTAGISDDQNKSSRFFLNWDDQMRSLLSPFGKHIHSLFLSSPQESDEVPLTRDELAAIPNIFPLLRVLNNEYIKFNDNMLPKEVYRLYLLKYIAISGNLSRLPKSFKNLVELETLVIKTTARTLQIEGGIWNMEKLRHIRTNTSTQLPFPPETNSKTNSGGKGIHTLSTISPASCRKEIFSKTPNLRKLGVRGNLSEFLEEKEGICLFNNVQMLKCLVNLKLYGQYDKVLTVPMLDKFARRLKKLSFSGTLFEWKDMVVLGSLEELEVLKLDDYAFKGENWELSNNVVFRRLQYLRIGRTNLVTWKATENSFPALQSLILQNCYVITKIPEEFANVHTLKVMELFHVSESATQSAEEIRKNIKNDGFKLIITSQTSQKREGAMTAARDTLIEQTVSEAVKLLVRRVESWYLGNGGLGWEIQNWTSDIETFNARLEEAYKNPTQSVNVLIVKNFQTIVNEARDAFDNWLTVYYLHQKHKTFIRKFMVPRYRREVKSWASEIQSIRTKVNTIDQEHKKELETLCNYENNAPLASQESTVYDRKIEDIDQQVNMLRKKIENNVNGVCDIVYEIKDMTSQIKTFLEDLMKACKNPKANEHRVLKVIVKKFGILVNETMDAVTDYFAQEKKHGNNALAKSLDKIIAHCGKPNAYASGIPFIKERVKSIREDHTKDLLHLSEDYNKRGGAMTAARDTVIKQAVSEAVNELVANVERWSLKNGGIEWEIKSLTSDIETFNARLEQAYKNPTQSVNILIVKNFQTIVSEARDAVFNWQLYFNHRKEVKSRESEIKSLKIKVNTIDREYEKELESLCNYAPLIFQKSTVYDSVIKGIEQDVNMLHQKIEDNVNGVCDIVFEIKDMTSQIKTFTKDMVKACKNPSANEHRVLEVIVKKFRILMYEASDALTNYFAQEKKHGNNALAKSLDKIAHCGKPNAYASEIQSIKEKVKRISEDHTKDLLHLLEDYNKLRDMRLPKVRAELRENKMVGFNDDLKTIKTRLMEASTDFFVIPIVGNAGTGKTTFALKIFEDPEIQKYFTRCVWVHVSRGFHRKQKIIDILHQISNQIEDFSMELEDDELEAKVRGLLEDERYLIVLDDVREKEDWDSLKVAFPTNLKGSRVLVTTWSGNAVDSSWKSHSLGKLSNDDGWLLIKNNVLGKGWRGTGTLIEELGIKIAEKCNGLPYALVLVAENNNPSDSFSNLFNKRMGRSQDFLVKSLLLSSQKREIHSTPEQLETILKTFKYLEVLNIESLKFSSLPNELYSKDSRIKYLAITADINSLPKSFEHLSWLETLVIKTTKRTLQINGGIWNMEKLRHVHTNTSTQLPTPPKTGEHHHKQTDIHTLSTISPESCTSEIFNKTPKLQKLGVRGNLSQLLGKKQNVCLFNNIQMLERLENLKLHGNSEKVELKVPTELDKFPRRLRKLTLSGTLFQWNDMTVLGLLEKLEVLKLDDNAFSGEIWNLSSDVIFKGLQYLRMGKMNLITWTAVDLEESFPVLESLVLRNCISLKNIPQDFANMDSLKVMELFNVSESVSDFAREICVKRHGKTNVKINGFNLFITPPPSPATAGPVVVHENKIE